MQRHLERHLVERHLDDEGTTLVSETSRSESLSVSISSHSSHSSDDEEMDGIDDAASRTPSKQYLIQIDSVDSHARTAMEIMYRKANAMDGHDSVHTDGDSMGLGSAMNGEEDDDLKREEMSSRMTSSFSPRQSVDEAEED